MTEAELLASIEHALRHGFTLLSVDLTPAMHAAFRARGLDVAKSLRVSAELGGVIDRHAVAYAQKRGGELIKDFAATTPEMLRSTVAKALEEGWSAGRLRDVLREDYAFSPQRALTIARTETQIARRAGGRVSAEAVGAKKKQWVFDELACSLCKSNGAAGWINIDEDFPEGDNPHPNCTCSIEYSAEEETGLSAAWNSIKRIFSRLLRRPENKRC